MKIKLYILFSLLFLNGFSQNNKPDFTFGNCSYFNINMGEKIVFNHTEIELLAIENHYNLFQINTDSVWIKVSRRTLPVTIGDIKIFVADNRNIKNLSSDKKIHELLNKDVLIGVLPALETWLDWNKYSFPVSFNDGFMWKLEEDSHMFSYQTNKTGEPVTLTHPGIDINLHDARGLEKHLLVATENSTVIWIEDKNIGKTGQEACVLLESESQPGIYYVYNHIYNKKIFVKKGDKLVTGEPIGSIWGNRTWGHLHFAVLKSDTVPHFSNLFSGVINVFPQLFELYFHNSYNYFRVFSKGRIYFGQQSNINGNEKNNLSFEMYSGKGWLLDNWNIADKVEYVSRGAEGNVRLKKTLFENEPAQCTNPNNYYDFEISVKNGTYRLRAKVGDLENESWQKINFEGITAATYNLAKGEQKWTTERIVKVTDSKLTVRIFIDETNQKVAGISEIVFQQVY